MSHDIDDASEIISHNADLENQITHLKNEKEELNILNDGLYQKLDQNQSENHKLKEELHGSYFM